MNGLDKLEAAVLICALLAVVTCCVGGIPGIIGLVLCIIAIRKGKKTKRIIVALICSMIGLFATATMLIFLFSDAGKEMRSAYKRILNESRNISEINNQIHKQLSISEVETALEQSVKVHEGSNHISSKAASKVMIDDNTISIPCRLSSLMKLYNIKDMGEMKLEAGMQAGESKTLYLDTGEEDSGISVVVKNNSNKTIKDPKKLSVTSISIDDYSSQKTTVLGKLTVGMLQEELEKEIDCFTYNKSAMNEFVFYTIQAGDDLEYFITFMLTDERVSNISIFYLNE